MTQGSSSLSTPAPSASLSIHDEPVGEHTPLLSKSSSSTFKAQARVGSGSLKDDEEVHRGKKTPTPLPMVQISIIMLLQLCEPLTSHSIFPYINQVRLHVNSRVGDEADGHLIQLVSELPVTGGDERKVGYYAGLIVRFRSTLARCYAFSLHVLLHFLAISVLRC